jgi:hypothetical protein
LGEQDTQKNAKNPTSRARLLITVPEDLHWDCNTHIGRH